MRLLLDEGFPSPPEFEISTVDDSVEVVALRDCDRSLTGTGAPDWYLYLRADRAGFDLPENRIIKHTAVITCDTLDGWLK